MHTQDKHTKNTHFLTEHYCINFWSSASSFDANFCTAWYIHCGIHTLSGWLLSDGSSRDPSSICSLTVSYCDSSSTCRGYGYFSSVTTPKNRSNCTFTYAGLNFQILSSRSRSCVHSKFIGLIRARSIAIVLNNAKRKTISSVTKRSKTSSSGVVWLVCSC